MEEIILLSNFHGSGIRKARRSEIEGKQCNEKIRLCSAHTMHFEKYPLWELNINSEGLLMVEINVHEKIFQSAETLLEF